MEPIITKQLGIRFGNMIIPPLLYQDDTLLASISTEKCKECLILQTNLKTISYWTLIWRKVKLCTCTHFDRRKQNSTEMKLRLKIEIVKEVETYKYLVDLKDNKNSLDKTISNRRNSAKAIIIETKVLVNQTPLKEKSLEISIRHIECILIPKMLYGCGTWSKRYLRINSINMKTYKRML